MQIKKLEKTIGYTFKNPQLLTLALSHRSYSDTNNERMEFLGDSLLNLIIAETLFEQYPESMEGDLSRIRAYHVNKLSLAQLGTSFDLGDYMLLGSGELKSGGFRRESILADTVEAIIAAIYLDSDFLTCRQCVLNWYKNKLADLSPKHQKDPKTKLQEYMQARKIELPIYQVTQMIGKEHQQEFIVSCSVPGLTIQTSGTGSSRRRAEQMAAEKFLKELKHD